MNNESAGLILTVPQIDKAKDWLKENLFFSETAPCVLTNGSCVLRLQEGTAAPEPALPKGTYYTGPAHIALRAADIQAAQAHCQDRGLTLSLENGHSFFNPGVYGGGEHYFNILSPFGIVFEVSQRDAQPHYGEKRLIEGLDHVGLPSADFTAQVQALQRQGFAMEFEPVSNYNDREGNIRCSMLRRDSLVLEVYQFMDMTPRPQPQPAAITVAGVALL